MLGANPKQSFHVRVKKHYQHRAYIGIMDFTHPFNAPSQHTRLLLKLWSENCTRGHRLRAASKQRDETVSKIDASSDTKCFMMVQPELASQGH